MTKKEKELSRNYKDAEVVAQRMVAAFKANSTVIGVKSDVSSDEGITQCWVSDEGLAELSSIFGEVPVGSRATVYSLFTDYLDTNGIMYDVTQFGGTIH